MAPYVRVTESFDPAAELLAHHSGWSVIQTTCLSHEDAELFFPDERTVFVNPTLGGLDWALAHVTAHLDLGHHLDCTEGFTVEQEAAASWLAALRMDYRAESTLLKPILPQQSLVFPPDVPRRPLMFDLEDFPMDGPPSVAL